MQPRPERKRRPVKTSNRWLISDNDNDNETFTKGEIIAGYVIVVSILLLFVCTCPGTQLQLHCSTSSIRTYSTLQTNDTDNYVTCLLGWNVYTILQVLIGYCLVIVSFLYIQGSHPGTTCTSTSTTAATTTTSGNTDTETTGSLQSTSQSTLIDIIKDDESKFKKFKKQQTYKRIRPIRTYYCTICNTNVIAFDHHCEVLHTCIGENNRGRFFIFLLVQFTTVLLCLVHLPMPIPFYYNNNNNTINTSNDDNFLLDLLDYDTDSTSCNIMEEPYSLLEDQSYRSNTVQLNNNNNVSNHPVNSLYTFLVVFVSRIVIMINTTTITTTTISTSELQLIVYFWIIHCTFYAITFVITFLLLIQTICAILNVTMYELSSQKYKTIMLTTPTPIPTTTTTETTEHAPLHHNRYHYYPFHRTVQYYKQLIQTTTSNIIEYFYLTSYY